jgi:hypothetical protein
MLLTKNRREKNHRTFLARKDLRLDCPRVNLIPCIPPGVGVVLPGMTSQLLQILCLRQIVEVFESEQFEKPIRGAV